MLLAAYLRPELMRRLEGKVAERSVRGGFRPLLDAIKVRLLLGGEEVCAVPQRPGKPTGAEVVLSPLKQHGLELLVDQPLHQRDILVEKLFLKVDRVGADECLATCAPGMEHGGEKIGQ